MTAPDPLHEILRRLILGDGETRIDSFEAADRVLAAGWLPPRPAPSGPCREEIARLFRDFGLDPRDSVHFLLIDVLAGMLGRARTAIAQERT